MAGPGEAPAALLPVTLAALTAKQLACLLVAPPPRLLIDCGGLLLPHPLGVGRFVSQLLLMRRRGTCIWLCNLHPGLRGCLYQLELHTLFHVIEQGKPTGAAAAGLASRRATVNY